MSQRKRRTFSREFKLEAVRRMEAGEGASALARALAVKREVLYRWRAAHRAGGALALREGPGRPRKAEALALAAGRGPAARASDLGEARRRIAELEGKVGRQQVELDFFKQALRHVEATRRPRERPGAPASTPSSRRGRSGKAS